jgi:hypothetical protein
MGLFKKKEQTTNIELKCPVKGCPFTCNDHITLKKHTEWKHPELTQSLKKA